MGNRRMFSLDVVGTDLFLEMPLTTQALYFHLGMRTDDDGFVSSPKTITRTVGCSTDDIRILISKGYIIPLDNGVVVISDWNINNWVRPDRKRDTRFKELKEQLVIENGRYKLTTNCQPDINHMSTECHTEGNVSKGNISKDNINNCDSPYTDSQTTDSQTTGSQTTGSSANGNRYTNNTIFNNTIINKNSINTSYPETEEEPAAAGTGIQILLDDGTTYNVPVDKLQLWVTAYPEVNVEQELRKMVAWCDGNPTRRKTRRGICRFINSWLSRSQNDKREYNAKNQPKQQERGNERVQRTILPDSVEGYFDEELKAKFNL